MNLSPYLDSVRNGVADAAALADEHTRQIADQLSTAVESSARLALIHALSDAASTISAELAPSSVELRMVGSEPEFAVTLHSSDTEPPVLLNGHQGAGTDKSDQQAEPDDEPVSRLTLRLPQSVKAKVDEVADADGISTNAWLIRAVMDALADRSNPGGWPQAPGAPRPPRPGSFFGPDGPFGPHGVFGPHGPFGHPTEHPGGRRPDDPKGRGSVQGWVR